MKNAGLTFIAIYYLLGNLLLPMGDFSAIVDLPAMYNHCKATEDKDLGPLDFITDHLINIDGLFDDHAHGDPQKPHTPFPFHHQLAHSFIIEPFFFISSSALNAAAKTNVSDDDGLYDGFISQIPHPPDI